MLAKSIVAIDHLSGGRFEPGFGAGWHEPEFRAHGYAFHEVGTRFDQLTEGLEIISAMLGDATSDDVLRRPLLGRRRHLRARSVRRRDPAVDRRSRTSTNPAAAARFCSGWNVPYVGPDDFRRLNERLDRACDAIDRDPATLERSVNLAFHLGADRRAADAELRRIRDQWGREAERVTAGALTGTPDEAVEQIAAFRAAGADLVNVALRLPVDGDALDAYLDVVVPAARAEFV